MNNPVLLIAQKQQLQKFPAFMAFIDELHKNLDDDKTNWFDKQESLIRSCYLENVSNELANSGPKVSKAQIPNLRFLSTFKPDHMINTYFDQIYILNLDSRPDRMAHMNAELQAIGIYNYQRFRALNGREEPHLSEWQKYSKMPMTRTEKTRYQRKAIASPGSWAILKSMYLMIRQAQERGYRNFLVFQDDLLFHKRFHQIFERVVTSAHFPKDWRLLYLGATQHMWAHATFHKSRDFYYPNGTADGAFAVAVDSSIYDQMIDEILEFDAPVDAGTLKNIQRRHSKQSVVIAPNLAIADIRDSDLRGYRNLDAFAKKFRWDLKDYKVVDTLIASQLAPNQR